MKQLLLGSRLPLPLKQLQLFPRISSCAAELQLRSPPDDYIALLTTIVENMNGGQ
jgi:hypothetical protein